MCCARSYNQPIAVVGNIITRRRYWELARWYTVIADTGAAQLAAHCHASIGCDGSCRSRTRIGQA
jgi:hypothetical protein